MAVNVVNKDLESFQFQEGRPTQSTPVTYRPTRPLLPISAPAVLPQNEIQNIKNNLVEANAPVPIPVTPSSLLAVSEVQGFLQGSTVTGTLRIKGAVPPAGIYRVSLYTYLRSNPSPGTLTPSFGWNDGFFSRSTIDGSIDTSDFNLGTASLVVRSDGVHDITWTLTLA